MRLSKDEVVEICDHIQAYTLFEVCEVFQRNYKRAGDSLLSDKDLYYLRDMHNLSREKSKNFGHFIEALYGVIQTIPDTVIELFQRQETKTLLRIEMEDPKGEYMKDKVLPALMQVIAVHHSDVTSLSFANCKLDAKKAIVLKEELFAGTWSNKILHLNLSHNKISDNWLDSFKTIVKQRDGHALEILELSWNKLGVFTGT